MSKSHFTNWNIDSNDQPRKGDTQSKPAKAKTVITDMATAFDGIDFEEKKADEEVQQDETQCPKCNDFGIIEEQDGVACDCPAGEGPREDHNSATQENAMPVQLNEIQDLKNLGYHGVVVDLKPGRGDHKALLLHNTAGHLVPDEKGRTKGSVYTKGGRDIYAVTVDMMEDPAVIAGDGDRLDVWVGNLEEVNAQIAAMEATGSKWFKEATWFKEEETRAATPASDAQEVTTSVNKENSMDKTIVPPIPSVEGEAADAEVLEAKAETMDLMGTLVGMSKEVVDRFVSRVFQARTAKCQWFHAREAKDEDLKSFNDHSPKIWKTLGSQIFMVVDPSEATHFINQKFHKGSKGFVPYSDEAVVLSEAKDITPALHEDLSMAPVEYIDNDVLGRPVLRWTVINKGVMSQADALMAALTAHKSQSVVDDLVSYDDSGDTVYLNVTWSECEKHFGIHGKKGNALKVIKRLKRIFDADRRVCKNVKLAFSGVNMDGRLGFIHLDLLMEFVKMAVENKVINEPIHFKEGDVVNGTVVTGIEEILGIDLSNLLGKGDLEVADSEAFEATGHSKDTILLNGPGNFVKEIKFKGERETKLYLKLGQSDKRASVSQLSFLLIGGSWACFYESFKEELSKLQEVVNDGAKVWDKFKSTKSGWMKRLYDAHVEDPDNKVLELLATTWYSKNQMDALKGQMRQLSAKGPGTMKVSPTLFCKFTYVGNNDRDEVAKYIKTVGNIFVCGKLMVCSAETLRAVGDVHGGMDLDDKVELIATFDFGLNKFLCYGFRWPVGYREWFQYNVWVGDGREIKTYDIEPLGDCPVGHGPEETLKDDDLCGERSAPAHPDELFDIRWISGAVSDQKIIGEVINAQIIEASLGNFDAEIFRIRQSDLIDLAAQGECKGGHTLQDVRNMLARGYAFSRGEVDGILSIGPRSDKKNRLSTKWKSVKVSEESELMTAYNKVDELWKKVNTLVLGKGGVIAKKAEELRKTMGAARDQKLSPRVRDLKGLWGRLWAERFSSEASLDVLEENGQLSEKKAANMRYNLNSNSVGLIMSEMRSAFAAGEVMGEAFQEETALGLLLNFLNEYGTEREPEGDEEARMRRGMDTVLFSDEIMEPLIDGLVGMLDGKLPETGVLVERASSREWDSKKLGTVLKAITVLNKNKIPFVKHVNVSKNQETGEETLYINLYFKGGNK